MRGRIYAQVLAVVLGASPWADAADPRIKGDTKVPRDALVVLSVDAPPDAAVTWRVVPSAGVTRAPRQPAGQFVFNAPPGVYQVDTLVIDWAKKTVTEATETVTIGGGVKPPPVDPDKPPPVDPDKPPPAKSLYFLVVRPDGPATPDFVKAMQDPAWEKLAAAGHAVKDKTLAEAAALGVRLPPGTVLPCVVTLAASADGKTSRVAAGPVPVPSGDAILKLPEAAK